MRKKKIIELGKEDIPNIINLSKAIEEENRLCFSCHEWLDYLEQGIRIWGIFEDKLLVAIGSISFYDYLGNQTDYLHAVAAVMTNGQVHPSYRGHGYQRLLIRRRLIFCLRHGIYNIHALVKQENFPAKHNLCAVGFVYHGPYYYPDDDEVVDRLIYRRTSMSFLYQLIKI